MWFRGSDVGDPADYGFSLLFTAGKLAGDLLGVMFVQFSFYQFFSKITDTLLQKNATKLSM